MSLRFLASKEDALAAELSNPTPAKTRLDDYVARPDPSFAWKVVGPVEGMGRRSAVLELTSQTWLSPDQVDRPVWKHWLTVIVPDEVLHDTAFLYITGGKASDPAPTAAAKGFARLAVES